MDALELFLWMALGVFRVARRYMCWFVGDIVAGVRGIEGSGVRPLGFQGEWGVWSLFLLPSALAFWLELVIWLLGGA